MDRSAIPNILRALNLNENEVANIYHHGSWVYGTNSPTSDRDLTIVIRSSDENPLKFWSDFAYFHDHQTYKLWNLYDISIYSVENFELLLEKTFLIAVQCLFLPDEYRLKEEIDFRNIYLEKYYNPLHIKQAAFYEMYRDWKLYRPEHDFIHSPASDEKRLSRRDYISKHLFHGLRYLDFAEQLIQTKSIHNFKRVSYLFNQIKSIRDNPIDESSMKRVVEYVREKDAEFKAKLDLLVPTNIIKGTFEVYITFDYTDESEQFIENLKSTCETTTYKTIFIQLEESKSQEITVVLHYDGEYPLIIKQIEDDVYQTFKDLKILYIRIESLTSNEGIPETYTEKKLFWTRKQYFQFHYNIPFENDRKGEKFKKLANIYRSTHRLNSDNLQVSRVQFKEINEKQFHHINILRLFNVGRETAFMTNDEIIKYATNENLPISSIKQTFVVYDTSASNNS